MTATYTQPVMFPEPTGDCSGRRRAVHRPDHAAWPAPCAAGSSSAVAPLGLRARHLVALTHLSDHGPTPQQTLIEALGLDASNLVALLNELEDAGLIVRSRDRADRRRGIIELSAEGERVPRDRRSRASSRSTTRCSRRSAATSARRSTSCSPGPSAPLCEREAACDAAEAAEECDPPDCARPLPATAVHDLVERAPVGPPERRRAAGRRDSRARAARRRSDPRESPSSERASVLIGDRGVAACRCRGRRRRSPCSSSPARGRTARVLPARRRRAWARSGRSSPPSRRRAGAAPHGGELAPTARDRSPRRSPTAASCAPTARAGRPRGSGRAASADAVVGEDADIAARADRIPGLHGIDDSASLRATGVPTWLRPSFARDP